MTQMSSKLVRRISQVVPTVELVEQRALKAYHRRFGADADPPSPYLTVIEDDAATGGQLVHLANVNGRLASYRIAQGRDGWRLSYVDRR